MKNMEIHALVRLRYPGIGKVLETVSQGPTSIRRLPVETHMIAELKRRAQIVAIEAGCGEQVSPDAQIDPDGSGRDLTPRFKHRRQARLPQIMIARIIEPASHAYLGGHMPRPRTCWPQSI